MIPHIMQFPGIEGTIQRVLGEFCSIGVCGIRFAKGAVCHDGRLVPLQHDRKDHFHNLPNASQEFAELDSAHVRDREVAHSDTRCLQKREKGEQQPAGRELEELEGAAIAEDDVERDADFVFRVYFIALYGMC